MLVMLIVSIMMIDVQTSKYPEAVNGRPPPATGRKSRPGRSLGPSGGRVEDLSVSRPSLGPRAVRVKQAGSVAGVGFQRVGERGLAEVVPQVDPGAPAQ
jgi:hypothetical protein